MDERLLFDFADPEVIAAWHNVDDGVMGGASSSALRRSDTGGGVFAGHVSLDNNGGFASVRAPAGTYDLQAFDRLLLRVRGDGHRYKLSMYTSDNEHISYRATFTPPAGLWTVATVSFQALVPAFRGRRVPDAPPFRPARITGFGLLIADRQEGPFRLEVQWIKAAHTPSGS